MTCAVAELNKRLSLLGYGVIVVVVVRFAGG